MGPSRRTTLLLVLAMAVATACAGADQEPAPEPVGKATLVEGPARVEREGNSRPLERQISLLAGDTIIVDGTGAVDVILTGGRSLRLVGGSLEMRSNGMVELSGGSLLARSRASLRVRMAGVRASFEQGAVRFDDSGSAPRIGAYEALGLSVRSGTLDVPIPRYWQISVVGDGVLDQAKPLQFNGADRWDRELLGPALELDATIANLVRGLSTQLGGTTPNYLVERLGGLGVSAAALEPFSRSAPAEKIVAASFALEWRKQAPPELATAFSHALALYVIGATWGLLVQQFEVDEPRFVARLQEEINLVPLPGSAALTPGSSRPTRPSQPANGPAQPPGPEPAEPGNAQPVLPVPSPGPTPLLEALPRELQRIIDELFGIVDELLAPIV
ncbi:MAG: hypothetical protein ACT4OM_07920 [Actinomycetota bacterium]